MVQQASARRLLFDNKELRKYIKGLEKSRSFFMQRKE